MTRLLIVAVFVRGFYLPLEYIPLAKGDSVSYLIIELSYSVVLIPSMIFFQNQFDITGMGIALLFSSIIILLFDLLYCYWKYDYLPDENVIKKFMVYLFLLSIMCGIIFLYEDFIEIALSSVVVIVISVLSIKTLSRKVPMINEILKKCRLKCK
jgi:O-antigen/teichoic acid export membrane protein